MINTPWLITPERRPQAEVSLLCMPYAGGGVASFRSWAGKFSHRIETSILQLPGRENRFREPFVSSLEAVVDALGPVVAAETRPLAFFGHSMGALVAFELVRWLQKVGANVPVHLLVAGKRAPHVPLARSPLHELNDEMLIRKLHQLNGTPKQVLETPELLSLLLPRVRADFEINETYRYSSGDGVSCPLTVLGGRGDPETCAETLAAWREHADESFALHMFDGDHFFIHDCEGSVISLIERTVLHSLAVGRQPVSIAV